MVPTVYVVDDDVSVRESLELLIGHAGWRPETFASAQEFLVCLAGLHARGPACLVLDVSLPDLDGLELQQRLAGVEVHLPIVFITGYGDVPTSMKAMKAGAIEFLTKPLSGATLLEAIGQAVERSRASLDHEARLRAVRDDYESLSRREREVMAEVVAGRPNKQIALDLGISEITVKAHRGQVMRKMHADSVPDLVRMAASLGLPSASHRAPEASGQRRASHAEQAAALAVVRLAVDWTRQPSRSGPPWQTALP